MLRLLPMCRRGKALICSLTFTLGAETSSGFVVTPFNEYRDD